MSDGKAGREANATFVSNALEATVRVGGLVILAAWCFEIIRPFIAVAIWGIIIAVALYPFHLRIERMLKGRRRSAATLVTLIAMMVLIVPVLLLAETSADGAQIVSDTLRSDTLRIPPPPESVSRWPIIGEPVFEFWLSASKNIGSALRQIEPQLKAFGRWVLGAAGQVGLGILQFFVAVIIAGVLLAHAQGGHRAAEAVFVRLAGERGKPFLDLSEATVRSVARGILGVAFIQALLAGLGMLVAGVPGAGIWALVALLLCVVQLGPGLVLIPAVIYVFWTGETVTAVLFLVWSIFVMVLDNVLKPLLLGRGLETPMPVIFVGAIGGFLSMGIVGLFVGAIVLVLSYELFRAWLRQGQPD